MAFSRSIVVRYLAAITLACGISTGGWAQAPEAPQPQVPAALQPKEFLLPDYSKPRSPLNPIAPYMVRHVAEFDSANTPRLQQLMRDGKLVLSMDDAVALALENNLDIAIARYNNSIADTDILRARAGASILGGNFGVVQGTPGGAAGGLGGAIGSGPGGTTVGAGGAGAGSGGLVTSTLGDGPLITSFDPIFTGTLQSDHSSSICTNFFCGTRNNTGTEDFNYQQGFITGTNLNVGFNNSRAVTNNQIQNISPDLASNFRFTLTQHVLQGFGFAPNTRFIRIAKNNREISDVTFRLQVITTVDQIENLYWDLVFQYENVRVQKESLAFANKTLSDTRKQVDIGSLAPIEVVRAQSTAAADQQALTIAQTNLELAQLLMKNALSRSLRDPALLNAEVIPTSTMQLPPQEPVVPTEDLVTDALSHRAELAEARINLTNTQISNKAIVSSLRPTVDVFAYYGGSGLGGSQNPANVCTAPGTPIGCNNAGSITPTTYGGTLQQLFNSTAPDKGMGVTLTIPLRNRAAQALQVRSELEYRQAELRLQQIENQVRIEVRQAQFSVQQNRASVDSAQAAVALGHQSLDAEQKKYDLGASTTTLVLQQQSTLASAESTLVSAMAAYEKSQVELDRATGLLLDHSGIDITEAMRAQVTHLPTVPFVTGNPAATAPPATSSTAPPQQ